ncbi:MAG: hypothetical protein U1E65_20270 [Myxococcota bacterium]
MPVKILGLASVCALVTLAGPAQAEEPKVLRLGDRLPLALVVGTPTGESAQARSSDVIRLISDHVREHTVFVTDPLEPTLLVECKGRLLCLLQKVQELGRVPRYLLVVSNVTRQGEADRISAQLLDVERALDIVKRASHTGDDWEAEVEASLNDNSTTTGRATVAGASDAARVIQEWFSLRFQPVLEEAGFWEAWGEVIVETPLAGLEITVDGAPVGATLSGETHIQEVRAGPRQIVLEGPSVERFQAQLEVQRGVSVRLKPDLQVLGSAKDVRTVVIIGGAVTAAVGLALSAVAIARHSGGLETYCFQGSAAGCSAGSGFESTSFSASKAAKLEPVNPSGLLLLPLGYSLLGAGASWSLGTLFSSSDDVPWIPLAIGAGIGIAAYGISAAVSTHAPAGSSP